MVGEWRVRAHFRGPGQTADTVFGQQKPDRHLSPLPEYAPVGFLLAEQWLTFACEHWLIFKCDLTVSFGRCPQPTRSRRNRQVFQTFLKYSFDGTTLTTTSSMGDVEGQWTGVSVRRGYQSPEHQTSENVGPIPEGTFSTGGSTKMSTFDNVVGSVVSPISQGLGLGKVGMFPGGSTSWGEGRVSLSAQSINPDAEHRDGFTIHGGTFPGDIAKSW